MSKHETPMIRAYWGKVGGTLVEEFPVVCRSASASGRWVDAIIIRRGRHRIRHWSEVSLEGKDIIVVQAKASRLGMYLMGQAVFSEMLVKPFRPRSIRSIALCTRDDSALRPLLKRFRNIEVVLMPPAPKR